MTLYMNSLICAWALPYFVHKYYVVSTNYDRVYFVCVRLALSRVPDIYNNQLLHRMNPKAVFNTTPMTTANCLRLGQTPSSLNPQMRAPRGQKKPVKYPYSISSSPPSSTVNPAPQPASPSPVNAGEGSAAVESSHRSSSARISVGLGIVSGVWVYERLFWNCERRAATSWGMKPELKRRSKPWGALPVTVEPRRRETLPTLTEVLLRRSRVAVLVWYCALRAASEACAEEVSAARSLELRASPSEQWT